MESTTTIRGFLTEVYDLTCSVTRSLIDVPDMKRLTLTLLAIALGSSACCGQVALKTEDVTKLFPFVHKGHLYYQRGVLGQKMPQFDILLYRRADGESVVLSHSLVGITEMVRAEFSEGAATETFIRNQLPDIFGRFDSVDIMVSRTILAQVRISWKDLLTEQDVVLFCEFLGEPQVSIHKGRWKIHFATLHGSGGVRSVSYTGNIAPFEITGLRSDALLENWWMQSADAGRLLHDAIGHKNDQAQATEEPQNRSTMSDANAINARPEPTK